MPLLHHIKRLLFVDFLINRKATGNPKKFAYKNRLGRSSMMNLLKEMKELGFDVKYNKDRETYFYGQNDTRAKLLIEILQNNDVELLTREQAAKIIGDDVHNLCFSKVKIFEVCES